MDRITIDVNQCGGMPYIRSMRICVKDVLDMMAVGATEQDLLVPIPQ